MVTTRSARQRSRRHTSAAPSSAADTTPRDLARTYVRLDDTEREVIRQVYFLCRTVGETAADLRLATDDVRRSLVSGMRAVARLHAGDPGLTADSPKNSDRWWCRIGGLRGRAAHTITATTPATAPTVVTRRGYWVWDTHEEAMTWSTGVFDIYGYLPGAVPATITRHQEHKIASFRQAVEAMILRGVTADGPVVLPQDLRSVDGGVRSVVMTVRREPGPREVLRGMVQELAVVT